MADRFYKDIELPDLTGVTPSAPDSGFIQVYGKGGKLAYQAADGIEVIAEVITEEDYNQRTAPIISRVETIENSFLYNTNGTSVSVYIQSTAPVNAPVNSIWFKTL